MTSAAIRAEALSRATQSDALSNLPTIYAEFAARGIDDIRPRVNVLTFHAWRALGRHVKRGEHGVRICTRVPMTKKTADGETIDLGTRPRFAYVFHITQTEPDTGERHAES